MVDTWTILEKSRNATRSATKNDATQQETLLRRCDNVLIHVCSVDECTQKNVHERMRGYKYLVIYAFWVSVIVFRDS